MTERGGRQGLTDDARSITPNLLSLPAELRNKIYSYLLQTCSNRTLEHGLLHGMSPAILRVCRQTYHEGYSIFRQNGFVKVLYSGPPDYTPEHGFVRACIMEPRILQAATGTVCTFEISARRAHRGAEVNTCAIMTIEMFGSFLRYLYARQIVWIPSTIVPQPFEGRDGEVWWLHINLRVSFPPSTSTLQAGMLTSPKSIRIAEENAVYELLQEFHHPDNTLVIIPRALSWTASITSMNGPLLYRRLRDWIPHALKLSLVRKQHIDSLFITSNDSKPAILQYISSEYRSLCLDLQFFMECCELSHNDNSTEALGEYRGQVLTLLCSTFYCYAYIHGRYNTSHPSYWPFQRSCPKDICVCHALIQTDANIAAYHPTPDLAIPLGLWYRMQHLATVLHYIVSRSLKAAERALRRIQFLCSVLPEDEYLSHDRKVFIEILGNKILGNHCLQSKGEWQFSLFVSPPHIFDGDGILHVQRPEA